MTDSHAARILAMQERLELRGWHFDVAWFDSVGLWSVHVWHRHLDGQRFTRNSRADALAQALQYAELEQTNVDAA